VRKDPEISPKAGEVKQTGNRIGGGGILFSNLLQSYKEDFCFLPFMGRTFLGRKESRHHLLCCLLFNGESLCSLRSFVAIW